MKYKKTVLTIHVFVSLFCIIGIACIADEDILLDSEEAAYVSVLNDENGNIDFISCLVFTSDKVVTAHILYPPNVDPSTMTWSIDRMTSLLLIHYEDGSIDEYKVSDSEIEVLNSDNNILFANSIYSYVGSLEDAIEFTDEIVEDTYPGGVNDNTLHYLDAQSLYDGLKYLSVSPEVAILETDGHTNYFICYRGLWFSNEDEYEDNIRRIVFSFAFIGLLSSETDWSSSDAFVMFEDYTIILSTSECRHLVNYYIYPLTVAGGAGLRRGMNSLEISSENSLYLQMEDVYHYIDYCTGNAWNNTTFDHWQEELDLSRDATIEAGYYLMSVKFGFSQGDYDWRRLLREWEDLSGFSVLSATSAFDVLTYIGPDGHYFMESDRLGAWDAWLAMSGYPDTKLYVLEGVLEYILDHCNSDDTGLYAY